jgi:hypothetical protein
MDAALGAIILLLTTVVALRVLFKMIEIAWVYAFWILMILLLITVL